jgi:ligand-binding SRPBCC domain-containing protein
MQAVCCEQLSAPIAPIAPATLWQEHEQHAACQEVSCQVDQTISTPLQGVLLELHRLHHARDDERAALLDRARSEAYRMRETLCELHSRYA